MCTASTLGMTVTRSEFLLSNDGTVSIISKLQFVDPSIELSFELGSTRGSM